jgi:hypothetical protein
MQRRVIAVDRGGRPDRVSNGRTGSVTRGTTLEAQAERQSDTGAGCGRIVVASAAVAATGGPAPETIVQKAAVAHEVTLIEEEIGGASLATFYVFDKENAKPTRTGGRLAMSGGCSGCAGGGCLGAGGWHGDYSAGYNQAPPLLNEVDVPPRHWKKPGRHAHHKIHE